MEDLQGANERLKAHFLQTVPLQENELARITSHFVPRELKKKEMLLFKGEISNHLRFVARGCLRKYYLDQEAQEHITQFAVENWWVNDLHSFITQTPASHFVQAIEKSLVLQIHRSALVELLETVPLLERFFFLKTQQAYVALQERTLHIMSQTAEERYLAFCKRYRNIEQRVPQYMIASYLGMTPEFLSNIRKKIIHSPSLPQA